MNIAAFKEPGIVAMLVLLGAAAAFVLSSEQGRGQSGQPADFRYQGNDGFKYGAGKPEQDAGQRRARLSPDERRKLRRQIDEAGQDIYRVRR